MIKDDLGNRMKSYYEEVSKTRLVRRMPVIIRIDGKAFHTFTRGMTKPFDDILVHTMQSTTRYLCQHVQGCKLGYTQSDEISLLITDYDTLETSAWFDYEVQKMSSIAAAMATMAFNFYFEKYLYEKFEENKKVDASKHKGFKYLPLIANVPSMAMFDARCFNLPKEEVANYFYWRQLDAMRNSVNMVGQSHFNQKQMEGKSIPQVKEMLVQINDSWESHSIVEQRGSCVIKQMTAWCIDENMPIIKEKDREYVEKYL
jgi:tRNA(His) guanylyltransferase